jgi:hypothetical protein
MGMGVFFAPAFAAPPHTVPHLDHPAVADVDGDTGTDGSFATIDQTYYLAPAIAPAILAVGGGRYGVPYAVAGVCTLVGATTILPVKGAR